MHRAAQPSRRARAPQPLTLHQEIFHFSIWPVAVIPDPKGGAIFPAGNEHRGCTARPADTAGVVAAVVMVTFNRPSYLQKATGSLLSVHRRDPANM